MTRTGRRWKKSGSPSNLSIDWLVAFVILGALTGMASGIFAGIIGGAAVSWLGVVRGLTLETSVALAISAGFFVGWPVGTLAGGISAGLAWGQGHRLAPALRTSSLVAAVLAGIAAFSDVLGGVTAYILGICMLTVLSSILGFSRLYKAGLREAPLRKLRHKVAAGPHRPAEMSIVTRMKGLLRQRRRAAAVAFGVGAGAGGLAGALIVTVGLHVLGLRAGEPYAWLRAFPELIGLGAMAGAALGSVLSVVGAGAAWSFRGPPSIMKVVLSAHATGASVGAGAGVAALVMYEPLVGFLISTTIGLVHAGFYVALELE